MRCESPNLGMPGLSDPDRDRRSPHDVVIVRGHYGETSVAIPNKNTLAIKYFSIAIS
jgi:hypothetical protein